MNKDKAISVQIEKEYDVTNQSWEDRVYIKLFVALRTSGLLKALGDKHFRSLVALALYMDKEGKCHPGLDQLASTLGVSKTSASVRYKELCAFRWNGQPIVTRREIRDAKTKERLGTEYTILVDSIKIFDNPGNMPSSSFLKVDKEPSSSFLEVGENLEKTPSSSFLEVDHLSQTIPETPENMPSSRKPNLGEPKLSLDEPNYLESTECIESIVKDETIELNEQEEKVNLNKKSIYITLEEVQVTDMGVDHIPNNFPKAFAKAIAEVKDSIETIHEYHRIAIFAHKDAEKSLIELGYESISFGPFIDDELTAKAFRRTMGQAKLGKIKKSIEGHFRETVKRMLIQKYFKQLEKEEKKKTMGEFSFFNWLGDDT